MKYKLTELTELPAFKWLQPPPTWGFSREGLFIEPAAGTDFWQHSHQGIWMDNGHLLWTNGPDDFVVSATVRLQPRHQYDQAGLMIRFNRVSWIKTSVEFEPGRANRLGVVVTQYGFSDWSTQDVPAGESEFSFRVARSRSEFVVSARRAGADWMQLRSVHLACAHTAPYAIGPYACSPKEGGFRCVFTELEVEHIPPAP